MEENVQEREVMETEQEQTTPETTENTVNTETQTSGEGANQEAVPTTEELTASETNVPSMNNTSENPLPETSSNTSVISNAATTSPNTRTETPTEIKVASDGSITVDGKPATNEQLEEYFDYTKYTDKQSARMVEGLLKSDTVTINGVSYKAELNQNGEMVSIDGTKRLTQEEIKGYFGEKGYEALVCKTTKDVTVDENGKIKIQDREEQIKLNIAEPVFDTNKSNTATKTQAREKSNTDKIKAPSTAGASSGGGGGYSGGGGGGYSGGSSGGGGLSSSGADSPNEEEVEDPGTPVIMVEFGQLEAIRDQLQTLKGQLSGVCGDYGSTIDGLSGNSSAWSGSDKDTYVSQKKGYVGNIGQVSSTLDAFVGYLDTCVNNYKELEAKLAAKQIS